MPRFQKSLLNTNIRLLQPPYLTNIVIEKRFWQSTFNHKEIKTKKYYK